MRPALIGLALFYPRELLMSVGFLIATITKQHFIDCTNRYTIGPFTIDLHRTRQHSEPITNASYCFAGGDPLIPGCTVLGALSWPNQVLTISRDLHCHCTAILVKPLDQTVAYFSDTVGCVK